ncbi:MAG: hypothetical protein CMO81_03825 [Waddliaceae bacterium]|nr:hypothetical protein [Waddliaceae bacterium]
MQEEDYEQFAKAIELVIHCCKQVHTEPRLVFFGLEDQDFVNIHLPTWLQHTHQAHLAIRKSGRFLHKEVLQEKRELYRRVYLAKAHIHHAISVLEKNIQSQKLKNATDEQVEFNMSALEHMEMSLVSILECLSRSLQPKGSRPFGSEETESTETTDSESDTSEILEEEEREAVTCPSEMAKLPQSVLARVEGLGSWVADFIAGQWAYWRGLPWDCARLWRRSRWAALFMLLFFPLTLLIYLIGGFYEVLQRRLMRRFYAVKDKVNEIYEEDNELWEPESRALVEDYIRMICLLAGRSYDFQLRSSFKGLPWKAVEYYLQLADECQNEEKSHCQQEAEDLIDSFDDLREEINQIYPGTFEDFEEECYNNHQTITSVIEYRQDLVADHFGRLQQILGQFASQVKLELDSEEEETRAHERETFEEMRMNLMFDALRQGIEHKLFDPHNDFSQARIKQTMLELHMLAVIHDLVEPRLMATYCRKDVTQKKLLEDLEIAAQTVANLSTEELELLKIRTLDPHMPVKTSMPNRIEIMRLSERLIPALAIRLFHHPMFDYFTFLNRIPGDLVPRERIAFED